ASLYKFTNDEVPIIGVGGIMSADDAFEKIAAGASLLQTYTGFVYGGPSFAETINAGLEKLLSDRGFSSLDEAVGSASQRG
ncbi:MAG: dihydroorotate dehydrogenase (quinone), partial [Blastocatellia bacterium]|nr:dihydroorotate dehydrogenase (quinone) [Blastocatellia bacterium]